MAKRITYGKVDLEQYLTESLKAIGAKLGITIPIRTEGWAALRKTVEDAAAQIAAATGQAVALDTGSVAGLSSSLAVAVPAILGQTVTPPPVINSVSAINVAENSPFSLTLIADQFVTWSITGGADRALFTLSGATLSLSAKDFEVPSDSDANETYIVQVTGTNVAGQATSQIITVSVTNVNDTNPTAFALAAVSSVVTGSIQTSNAITVAGLGAQDTAAASVSGAAGSLLSKNGGAFASGAINVANGDTLAVRHTASTLAATATSTVLSVGTTTATFTSTTAAAASSATMPATQTIPFGAKTRVGHGGSSLGYTGGGALAITAGNSAGLFALNSVNELVLAGVYGAAPPTLTGPYTLTVGDGTQSSTLTINIVANAAHVAVNAADTASSFQLQALWGANPALLNFGDTIYMRDGVYNAAQLDQRLNKAVQFTQRSGGPVAPTTDTDPGWVRITSDTLMGATITRLMLNSTAVTAQYIWIDGVKAVRPCIVAGNNAGNAPIANNSVYASSFYKFTNCDFSSVLLAGTTTVGQNSNDNLCCGLRLVTSVAALGNVSSVWTQNNTFHDLLYGISYAGTDIVTSGNTFRRIWADCINGPIIGTSARRSQTVNNFFTDKQYGDGTYHGDFRQANFGLGTGTQIPDGTYFGEVFEYNTIERGQGRSGFSDGQGFFLSNIPTTVMLTDVSVAFNYIDISFQRGISLLNCTNPRVVCNIVLKDQQGDSGVVADTGIVLTSCDGGNVDRNIVHSPNQGARGTQINIVTPINAATVTADNYYVTPAWQSAIFAAPVYGAAPSASVAMTIAAFKPVVNGPTRMANGAYLGPYNTDGTYSAYVAPSTPQFYPTTADSAYKVNFLDGATPGATHALYESTTSGFTPSAANRVTADMGSSPYSRPSGVVVNGTPVYVRMSAITGAGETFAAEQQVLPLAVDTNAPAVGYDVLVFTGQSNSGRGRWGPIDPFLDTTDPRIFMYTAQGNLVQASDPIGDRDTNTGVVGAAMTYAKQHLATLPSTRKVLIVATSKGGQGFSSGTGDGTGYFDYNNTTAGSGTAFTISNVNAAMALSAGAGGVNRLVAIIWDQGEANQSDTQANYASKQDAFIGQMRTSLTGASSSTPFTVNQLLIGGTQTGAGVQAAIAATPSRVAYTAFVSSVGFTDGGDNLHFDARSQRLRGQRAFYAAYQAKSNVGATPTLGALALSGSLTNGTSSSGTITGATSGSTIASNVTGLVVNSSARTYTFDGTGAAGATANGLVETLSGANGSPRSTSITVGSAAAPTLAALALSPTTATAGSAYSGTISNATAGSTITATASTGETLTVSGTGTTRTLAGTFAAASTSTISMVETLSGATGSPKTTTASVTVTAAGAIDTDVQAWANAVTAGGGATVANARLQLMSTLVTGLKSDGVWAKMDRLQIFAAPDSFAAKYDVRKPTKTATASSNATSPAVFPTFTVDKGYAGDGASGYLDMGEALAASGNNFTLNSAFFSFWVNAQSGVAGAMNDTGVSASGSGVNMTARSNGNEGFKINDGTLDIFQPNPGTRLGHRVGVRSGAAVKTGYYGANTGSAINQVSSLTTASTSVASVNQWLLRNTTSFSTDQIAYCASGSALTAADAAALQSRMYTFLSAIGAN